MRHRFSLILILVLLSFNQARAQFQAQGGWGKPRLVTTLTATGGLILDATSDTVIALEETGLTQVNLETWFERLARHQQRFWRNGDLGRT
jgi:hypothetical protein